jgi:hypothetical protein
MSGKSLDIPGVGKGKTQAFSMYLLKTYIGLNSGNISRSRECLAWCHLVRAAEFSYGTCYSVEAIGTMPH